MVSRLLLATLALAALCGGAAAEGASTVEGAVHKSFEEAPTEVSYSDYASLLAPAMLLAHGDWATADKAIEELFKQTGEALAGVWEVITGQQKPTFAINDPILFNNGAANVTTNVAGAQGLLAGINYNPCIISTSARGADVTAAGINIQPNVIEVLAEGVAVWPWAVNIQPALIYINPWGLNVSPAGVSVVPALIAVAPTAESDSEYGKLVQDIGIKVPP